MNNLGETEIFLAHIGNDDLPALKEKKIAFNMLLRRCGGIPIEDPAKDFCASIAFTNNLFREDFAREMHEKLGITVAIDFRRVYIDRQYLPPVGRVDRYDFEEIMRREKLKQEMERLKNGDTPPEEEYIYPTGKLAATQG